MDSLQDKTIIEVITIQKVYQKGNNIIHALHDVSFSVEEGEFISIVGKSGSGKSTLLNLIGGLDKASAGNIFFRNRDMCQMKHSELSMHRKHSIGMIFQSFNLINHQTALENVMLALTFGGVPRNERISNATSLLTQVGLAQRMHHKPSELSGGETQRVAIARALANNPSVLLADEPTGNLDSTTSKEIIELLLTLNKEKKITVLLVTHDLETASTVSGKVIRLKDGKITDIIKVK